MAYHIAHNKSDIFTCHQNIVYGVFSCIIITRIQQTEYEWPYLVLALLTPS